MKTVNVNDLKAKMDANENFQLIDVREQYEYDAANINAHHIPMGEILERKDEIKTDVPVIIHCRSGARSASVINALEAQFGMDNLHNLEGGIMAWAAQIDPSMTVS
jgi:rhodanese-related sulfurtransferase